MQGAVEDVLPRCDSVLTQKSTVNLDKAWINILNERCALLNAQVGFEVLRNAVHGFLQRWRSSKVLGEVMLQCGYWLGRLDAYIILLLQETSKNSI